MDIEQWIIIRTKKNSLNDILSKLYLLCTDTFMKYKTRRPWDLGFKLDTLTLPLTLTFK